MKSENVPILLVEDNPIDVLGFRRAFEQSDLGNPIFHAEDGIAALEKLRGENGQERLSAPYVIILDLNMPRMNGLEFLDAIRQDSLLKGSVVFVLSTSETDEEINAVFERQVAGYFSKHETELNYENVLSVLEPYCQWSHFVSPSH